MFILMGKGLFTILRAKICLSKPVISGETDCWKKRYYHVTLILTVEQEEAIVVLFKERQWKYIKAG